MPALTADAERVVDWLRTVPFCEGLDSEQLAAVASETRIRPFEAGETLASAGDAVTEFWILVEGELDSFLTDPRGREKWLGTIRRGETVGEIAILEQSPTRPVRYTARTHGTLLTCASSALARVGQDLSADDAEPVSHVERSLQSRGGRGGAACRRRA